MTQMVVLDQNDQTAEPGGAWHMRAYTKQFEFFPCSYSEIEIRLAFHS